MAAVRGSARYDIPVFAKLSPEVTDIVAVARACVAAGADGLSMINTLPGMAIDPVTFRPALAGPGRRPVRARPSGRSPCAASGWSARRCPTCPSSAAAACARAATPWSSCSRAPSMVAVGTVLFHDPSACSRIQRELEEELTARGVDRVSDVVGRAHQPAAYAAERHTWG